LRVPTIVAVGLFSVAGACGGNDGHVTTAKIVSTCIPTGADVKPSRMALTGATFSFCLAASVGAPYCFAADLGAKTIVPASPPATTADHLSAKDYPLWRPNGENPTSATLEPSTRGKGLTACTHDKATCHELPIDPATLGDRPSAVSDDAALVAIDMRSYRPKDMKSPGTVVTWDAATGKKLASFEMHYGPTTTGYEGSTRILDFLGHTVIAFTDSGCALPCSSATMYSVRGKYLGMLASDPTGARAERIRDEVYLLHSGGDPQPFFVQDVATGKIMPPDTDTNWDAVVTPDRIVRLVGTTARPPRVEVWGPDLTLVTTIAVPMCTTASKIVEQLFERERPERLAQVRVEAGLF
jgi:hypothetical protein